MSKDLLTTLVGATMAGLVGVKEYMALQAGVEDTMSWQFWVGMGSAAVVAVFGYWSKKGE